MKRFLGKGIMTLLMVLMVAMAAPSILPSNSVTGTVGTVEAASVKISATKATLIKGKTKKLKIKGTSSKVKWSSSKKSVATVNKNGKVTAKKKGKATITAKVGGKKYKCKITVEDPTISKTSASINKGETLTLKISGTSQSITWSSSDKSIATVSKKGVVTAKKAGTATITAKIGSSKFKCKVTVKTPVSGVSLNKTSLTLTEGDTSTLSATVSPSNASDKTVTWSSSSSSIASVNSSGKVTAKSAGTATITAKAGSKTAKCTVTVNAKNVAVTGISLNKTSLTLTEGDTASLTATVSPSNATDNTVTWSSDNSSVVSVDSNGKLTAKGTGEAVITAKAGSFSAKCTVTVNSYMSQFSSAEIMAAYSMVLFENDVTSISNVTGVYYGIGDMFANSEEKEVVMIDYQVGSSIERKMFWKVDGVSPVKSTIETIDGEYIQLSDAEDYLPSDLSDVQSFSSQNLTSLINYIEDNNIYKIYTVD